jgi:hypothetical protein
MYDSHNPSSPQVPVYLAQFRTVLVTTNCIVSTSWIGHHHGMDREIAGDGDLAVNSHYMHT